MCVLMSVLHTDLSFRHDIDIVMVQRECHVSENRAPVLNDGHRLVLHAAMRRPVHTDLKQEEKAKHISKLSLAHNNTAVCYNSFLLGCFANNQTSAWK